MTVFNDTIAETVTLTPSEVINAIYSGPITDAIRAFAFLDQIYAQPVTLSETITITDTPSFQLGVVLTEHILVGLTQITNQVTQVALTDALELLSSVTPAVPVTISETITLTLDQLVQAVVTVVEQLGIAETIAPNFIYGVTVEEAVTFTAVLAKFLGVEIAESVGIAEALAVTASRNETISETVTLSEAVSPQMILRVTVEDSLVLDDASILNAIYHGVIEESIELAAAYLSPGDGITTWAMNIRNGAVTEYDNYAFNSFAQMGHKYLGASQDGLYELLGDDDAGADIVAHIKSGFAQWAGTRFTMFKGVYLGLRGEGDFVLKLITGDGNTYIYQVNTRDMRTTRVRTGKGLRARYFAFELISTGQDFDFDTIEFIPLIADRRV